jgi:DNA-binding CsgD family transcriptional regulator
MAETFEAPPCYTWRTPTGEMAFRVHGQPDDFTPEDYIDTWMRGSRRLHPLVRWFAVTGDPAAMTLGRVPTSVFPPGDRDDLQDWLRPYGLEQQLSMPVSLGCRSYRTFVLARTGTDFDDEDVRIARSLQPLLMLLDRHVDAQGQLGPDARASGLSGRELAVLRLLADGGSASSIGHALGISPRTVHKHVERVYRKLGVSERVTAVRLAEQLGLVATPVPRVG